MVSIPASCLEGAGFILDVEVGWPLVFYDYPGFLQTCGGMVP